MKYQPVDRIRIAEAVAKAEVRTSGEIVCVLARASAGYALFPLVWAAALALVTPAPLIAATELPIQRIYGLQLLVFAIAAVVLSYSPIRMLLVPRNIQRTRAHDTALRQFRIRGIGGTLGENGILIFVSLAERYARIVVDDAIAAAIPESEWKSIVDNLVAHIREGRITEGYLAAIERSGELLAEKFPPSLQHRDELPNKMILI